MSRPAEFDAIIVGARVAGSSLAIRLAQAGHSVLLLDRDAFPSDTLSTHGLNFMAVDSLRRLGALDKVEAAGFRRVYRHRAWIEDIAVDAPAGPRGTYSLAPRRAVLDKVLLDRAVESGAEFLERTRVDGLLMEDGQVCGVIAHKIGGERTEQRARVVVGADGKQSWVAEWVGAERYNERPTGRPIYYGYFAGVEPVPEATFEIFFTGERIGFCLPMRPDEHCLVIEARGEEFDAIRSDPMGWFMKTYSALPGMASRVEAARLEGKLLGTRGVDNYFRKPYGPGWALIGDASYVKDPCTAYGIGDALLQAFWLSRALGDWFDGAPWESTMAAYQEMRDTRLGPLYEQTTAATAARDISEPDLNALRAVLINQHDARQLISALPAVLDDAFSPLDRFRHALIGRLFEQAENASS